METLWFCIAWGMLSTFVVLGGADIGVGILHLFVARTEAERAQVIRSIHSVWKPNEVWLVASGGILFVAFPRLLAVGLSGFYLALMIVLWLLVMRGLAIELRHRVPDRMWGDFWDASFGAASWLLATCLGAALGNLVRGVPMDEGGYFFEPLWTNFRVGADTGILDWYTILIAISAVLALSYHGALWLAAFTDGAVQRRASSAASRLWVMVTVCYVLSVWASFALQPQVASNEAEHPWGAIFPILAAVALACAFVLHRRGRALQAFIASCVSLYAVLASAAFGLHPYLLPARDPAYGLTTSAAAAPEKGLHIALYWWIPGMLLIAAYYAYVYAHMPHRASIQDDHGRL
jgi:cytochrome bd ubiquinol oxidase subunit II